MSDSDKYKTIKYKSESLFKDRLSKFIGLAYPVNSEEEVKEIIKDIKKKYHDARHYVYAFILGKDKKNYRYSDDGEPANSSGPPVFNAIKSFDLTNILVVVVRYFGGKKLGVPGLINAYRTAAEDAIKNSEIITEEFKVIVKIKFDYALLNNVMSLLKKENAEITEQNFTESCTIIFKVLESNLFEINEKLEKLNVEIL